MGMSHERSRGESGCDVSRLSACAAIKQAYKSLTLNQDNVVGHNRCPGRAHLGTDWGLIGDSCPNPIPGVPLLLAASAC